MVRGHVTRAYEAVVRVQVAGPSGAVADIEAAVDTGFTGDLTLPAALVTELGLAFRDVADVRLAGDAPAQIPVYRAIVIWNGKPRAVFAHCMEGTPLIGMHLLYKHLLTVQVVRDGAVTIDPIAQ